MASFAALLRSFNGINQNKPPIFTRHSVIYIYEANAVKWHHRFQELGPESCTLDKFAYWKIYIYGEKRSRSNYLVVAGEKLKRKIGNAGDSKSLKFFEMLLQVSLSIYTFQIL